MRFLRSLRTYRSVFGLKGYVFAIVEKLTAAQLVVSARACIQSHPLSLRLNSTDIETFVKVFIDEEYALPIQAPPGVVIDAGANVGFASVYFATRWPEATVFAIEPSADNFELLRTNTAAFTNIVPICAAIWNRDGRINLVDPGLGAWGYQTSEPSEASSGPAPVDVECITVATVMKRHGLSRIDVLKVDIESAEVEVFRNASGWIEQVNTIAIELHDRLKVGCSRAFYGAAAGFQYEAHKGENVVVSRYPMVEDASGSLWRHLR